jgi:hypothetical protein
MDLPSESEETGEATESMMNAIESLLVRGWTDTDIIAYFAQIFGTHYPRGRRRKELLVALQARENPQSDETLPPPQRRAVEGQ